MINVLLILCLLFFVACGHEPDKAKEPANLKGMPEGSFWIKSNGEGHWYLVDGLIHNAALIKIFNKAGELVLAKQFVLACTGENLIIEDLKQQIDFFDGQKIYLKSRQKKACYLM